jgi:asparagine synthase (glutamine-hydrolysing)
MAYQFLGYWGCASHDIQKRELEGQLAHVQNLQAKSVHSSVHSTERANIFRQKENYPQLVWNVAHFWEKQSKPVNTPINQNIKELPYQIAGISASGLSTQVDAWVKIGENRLILGREPFGRVPLYWMQHGKIIWFASRLQLLLPLIEKLIEKPQVSIPGFYGYNCFSYVPTPLTPVSEVFTIPAATELVWQYNINSDINSDTLPPPKSESLQEWCEASEQIRDEGTAVSQLQNYLKESINRQITDLKDEPVGVLLSGGLDSSIVAALLVQAGVKVRAYTLDFGTVGIPEYPYAEQVAQFLDIPLVKVPATPNHIKKALIPTVQAMDLPFGDGVTVPLYLLCQTASQETSVIFNGEGGDQLFAGWTNKPLIAAGIYQGHHPTGQETFIQQYLRTFHRLWNLETQVFQPEIQQQVKEIHPEEWLQTALDPSFCPSLMHRLRRATLMLKGAQNIHPRATNLGFAHGLSVRSPFCDLLLAEWTFSLSGELCLQGACEKYILKKAVENWLPPEIVWRQKRGMGVPLTSWCLNEFWYQIGNWLNPGILSKENRILPKIAAKIVTGNLSAAIQGRRIGEILWLLIMWQLWRINVLGEEIGKSSFAHPFILPRWVWKNYK